VRDLPSEFINRVVADLLKELLIRLPERRRPRAEHATPATTTWSRPKTLDQPEQYLRQGRSVAALKRAADALSDTEAALRLPKGHRPDVRQPRTRRMNPKAGCESVESP